MNTWHVGLIASLFVIVAVMASYAAWRGRWTLARVNQRQTAPGTSALPSQADVEQKHRPLTAMDEPESRDLYAALRQRMVQSQLAARDITDTRVLDAIRRVPRHAFVPPYLAEQAYTDGPLPIGHGQTISQPYIVALMTQLVRPDKEATALDIGTGSGYQAAILGQLCKEVYSIEIVTQLASAARKRLARLGYKNIHVRCGDGYQGWPSHAGFDLITVAAAPDHVPKALIEQLNPGGRLVIPVGTHRQTLLLVVKDAHGEIHRQSVIPVMFVPMTGQVEHEKR